MTEGKSDDELHDLHAHPGYEYATTEGPRKTWDASEEPPGGEGWERNRTAANPEGWERFDYTEESYWRRRSVNDPTNQRNPATMTEAEMRALLTEAADALKDAALKAITVKPALNVPLDDHGGTLWTEYMDEPTRRAWDLSQEIQRRLAP